MLPSNPPRVKYWLHVFLCVLLIYSTLSIVRPICEFLKANTPFALLANSGLIVLLGSVILYSLIKVKVRRPLTYLYLLLVTGLYVYGIVLLDIPEEKLHFVEYGFLGFLTYRAISLDVPGARAYCLAFLLTGLLGWGDEGIQEILPNRYYQFKDVILNVISGGLGLCLTYIMNREKKSYIREDSQEQN